MNTDCDLRNFHSLGTVRTTNTVEKSISSPTTMLQVKPPGLEPVNVRCEQQIAGGGWTVVMARFPTHIHTQHRLDFNRTWDQYKQGFGQLDGEFWIGKSSLQLQI